jgi:ADP-ribose pyrophosphatase YjhB (NUDIX family)
MMSVRRGRMATCKMIERDGLFGKGWRKDCPVWKRDGFVIDREKRAADSVARRLYWLIWACPGGRVEARRGMEEA